MRCKWSNLCSYVCYNDYLMCHFGHLYLPYLKYLYVFSFEVQKLTGSHYILNARQRNILLKAGITVFLIRELYKNCSETKTVSNESSISVSKHVIIFCMCAFFINEKKKREGSFEKSYQFSCQRYYS